MNSILKAVRQREYMEYGAFLNRALPDSFRKPGILLRAYRLRIAVPQKHERRYCSAYGLQHGCGYILQKTSHLLKR
jgi:hypothetical protein